MSEPHAESATGLATLPADDPERIDAYRRAASDPLLEQALDQGEQLIALLDALAPPHPPSESLLQRVSATVVTEIDRDQRFAEHAPWALVAAVAGPAALPLVIADWVADGSRLVASATLFVLAAGFAFHALKMRGLVLAAGLACGAVFTALSAGASGVGALHDGWHCLLTTLGCGALPLSTIIALAWKRPITLHGSALALAAVATTGGLAGVAALHVTCSSHQLGHLALFHGAPVAVAAAVAAAIAMLPPVRRLFIA